MKKRSFRKIISAVLTAAMILSVIPFGSVTSFAAASRTADKTCADLTFWVPEAIYLYPDGSSWTATTSTPFQYYINNYSDGRVKTSYDTFGNIYYSYANAKDTVLSARFMNSSFSTLSGGSINISNTKPGTGATITINGQSPELGANEKGCWIEWTLSFTDTTDGQSKKAYAYTYVYKPYVVPVGGFVRVQNTRYSDSYAQSITWLSGVHSITVGGLHDDGGYYPNYTGSKGFSAFITKGSKAYYGITEISAAQSTSLVNCTNGWSGHYEGAEAWNLAFMNGNSSRGPFFQTSASNTSCKGWGTTSSTGGFNVRSMDYWYKETDAENLLVNLTGGASGNITIDTSRYSNLKDIPNLAGGLMVTDDEASDEGGHWLVADASGITSGRDCDYWTGSSTCSNYLGYKNYAIARQGANSRTDWGDGSNGSWEEEGVKYAGTWPRTLLGSTGTQGGKYMFTWMGWYGNNDDGTDFSFNRCTVDLNATYYNKAKLRNAVETAIKKMPALGVNGISSGSVTSCFFDANTNYKWTALQSAYKAAVIALTQLDSTSNPDTLATNLTNALNALCTKWTLNANGGTLSGTTTGYATVGTNQKFTLTPSATGTRTGYSLAGWSTSSDGTAASSVSLGYNDTAYAIWSPNTITLKYSGNGNTGGQVPGDSTFKYGSRVVTADKLSRKHTVSYEYCGATDGNRQTYAESVYGWNGWKSSVNGKVYDAQAGVVDNFGATGGTVTLTAQWTPAAVTLPSPERTGYTFNGWYTAETGGVKIGGAGALYTPQADIKLYAQWTVNKYALNLDGNLDNNTVSSISGYGTADVYINGELKSEDCVDFVSEYDFGTSYEIKDIKAETGHTYDGASVITGTVGAKTNTVLLKFHTNTYTIKFNSNGATGGSTAAVTNAKWGENIQLPENGFEKSGYDFSGWAETPSGEVVYGNNASVNTLTDTDKGTVNLYAKWQVKNDRNFNVNVYVMDNTGAYPDTPETYLFSNQTTDTRVSVSYTDYIPAGKEASQFYLDTGRANVLSGTVAGDNSLNLVVYIARRSHTVTYNYSANGGTVASVLSAKVFYDAPVSFEPTAAKSGWNFRGWYIAPYESTGMTINSLTMETKDITLYAVFDCTLKLRSYYLDPAKKNTRAYTDTEATVYNTASSVSIRTYDGIEEYSRNFNDTLCTFIGYTTDAYTGTGELIGAGEEITFKATEGFADGKILGTYCASYDVLIELIHDPEGGQLTGKNSSTGGYLTTLSTKFAYTASAEFRTQPAPVRDGYTFIGWAKSLDASQSAYYDTEAELTTLYSVTLHAIWLKNWTESEDSAEKTDAESGMYVVSGINAGADGKYTPVNAEYIYKYTNHSQYTTLYNSYVRAQNNYDSANESNRFYYGKLLKTALDKVRTFTDESLTEENMTAMNSDYFNSFTISYSGIAPVNGVDAGIHTLADMNLNHYSEETLERAYELLGSVPAEAKAFDLKEGSELNNQEAMNAIVEEMAQLLLNVENSEENAPEYKVYETAGAIKALTGEDVEAVRYVYTGKGNYTYYCYTNSENPTVDILVNESGSKVSYPTRTTVSAGANGGYSLGVREVENTQYEKYLNAGIGTDYTGSINGTDYTGADYYGRQSFIRLTPSLSGDRQEVVYSIVSSDDAAEPNYASKSALSCGLDDANTPEDILTLSGGENQTVTPKNTLTVVICYKSASTMDAEGTKWESDGEWLNSFELVRDRGGTTGSEITGFRDKKYALDDPEYGQENYGSFVYIFKAGETDITKNRVNIDTSNVNSTENISAVCELLQTPVKSYDSGIYYLRCKQMFSDYTRDSKATKNGLGFMWWYGFNSDTIKCVPQSDSYAYVHLADRWGNTVNKIIKIENVDAISAVITGGAGAALIDEEGGSAVKCANVNAESIKIITDFDSSLEGNVYRSTTNTVKLYTGEADKTYTLGITDNAGNTSEAQFTTDSDGYAVLTFTDSDCPARPYTFTLGDYTVNLYDGEYKHIKAVENAVITVEETAEIIITTSDKVTMVQLVDAAGNTKTATSYTQDSTGARIWKITKSPNVGEYEYTVRAKVNGKWIDEGKTATLKVNPKQKPAIGEIISVDYTPAYEELNLYYIMLTGSPEWVQTVSPGGSTRTFGRTNASVKNIEETEDGEIWTIETDLHPYTYTVRARYNRVWCEGKEFTVELLKEEPDKAIVYSIETDEKEYETILSGTHTLTIVTSTNVTKVQLVSESGTTKTYTALTEDVVESDGKLIWTVTKSFKVGADQKFDVLVRTKDTHFTDSGTDLTVYVVY